VVVAAVVVQAAVRAEAVADASQPKPATPYSQSSSVNQLSIIRVGKVVYSLSGLIRRSGYWYATKLI